ncbi:disease resistance protein RPV1 [Lactuca sativa]|uniref:ADP-ribosyl cyclase/cyclic ADP-ribose hydrolase n=1 Tax=Lactuca sativa TaxID=4236 RepID=A0A9R1WN82_LACSA|nr:disease resistance protein RPV1 [Lactuca sativa]KAJ0225128.1 hypothetical protein LSAT_V11C100040480 [Lactuca sativa]
MVVLSELCEGSSCSSTHNCHRHDVFLSFRGVDTRHGFTNHLYNALMHANITTFLDDEDIETGEDLKPELESGIRGSRASVIVLSKNYATSTWCLDELVLILEQRMKSNHVVIPIFYHVKPSHVRKQQSSFGDAMAKHRQKMEAETNSNKRSQWAQKIELWNKALTEVVDLKGKDANGRLEVELIDEIVKDIFRRLRISSRFPLPQLIGMEDSINFVTSWLKDTSSHTTNILTILGMGGIGKTSLAKYVYALHFHEFDKSSFIEDIGRKCEEKSNGILDVQKQLFDDISKPSSVQVLDDSIYTSMIENAVARKKVFLVLDDISSLNQLDALLGTKGFYAGTKILVTTTDAWLTKSCALFKTNDKPNHAMYELKVLYEIDSQKLFCYHAFMCNEPKPGYEEVSKKLVKYCKGHPMALKVLGRSLHNRDVTYWEGYIDRLKKENDSPINNVLRMSFDSLSSENDKDLFKHIACIFVGMDRNDVVTILEACDIETRTGITNLVDKCLLSIGWNNELKMHELVKEMGRFVVREESLYKPWERSRIWGLESFKVLKQKKCMENVLGLTLDMRMLEKEKLHGSLELITDALSKMDSLMLLQLNYVQITGSFKNFPEELRWLCMHGFPLKSIPPDLPMENLVSLDMSHSSIESFGICYSYPQRLHKRLKQLIGSCTKDKKLLGSLKILNLSCCEQLHSLRGFDHLPKLERLILKGCIGLIEICESIEQCFELVHIDLSYCNKLEKLPRSLGMLKKVKTLLLDGCYLGESRIKIRDKKSSEMLKANNIGINTITSSSTLLQAMPSYSKFSVISLPRSLVSLSLENNNLSTESFPMDFSCLTMLKELYLDKNPIFSLPRCVRSLPRLEKLSMVNCHMLTSVEHPPHTLTSLNLMFDFTNKPLLRKVVFDPRMSPLKFSLERTILAHSSFEFEGMVKIQPMAGVEENILHCLGWTNLHFLIGKHVKISIGYRETEESEIQMYYEFGIFSTLYWGKEMPNWITHRSMGPSISFTIPSSPNNLTGLNFCYVLTSGCLDETHGSVDDLDLINLPVIKICNITKNLTWIYEHYIEKFNVGGHRLILLSHWMFGMNEMECGDQITITVRKRLYDTGNAVTKECGVSFVYDNGENKKEDVLGYYRSWNHIIGGDLTGFQSTTGEYILSKRRIIWPTLDIALRNYYHLCGEGAHFKDKLYFKALSNRKPGILKDGP